MPLLEILSFFFYVALLVTSVVFSSDWELNVYGNLGMPFKQGQYFLGISVKKVRALETTKPLLYGDKVRPEKKSS